MAEVGPAGETEANSIPDPITYPLRGGLERSPGSLWSARGQEPITYHGVQGVVPLVGLPQVGGLRLVVAAVALQLTLSAQSVQRGPSFQEGPHC